MNMKVIGEKIRQHRKIKGLTQEELAKESGLSTMSIRRYESGERIAPQDTLIKIARALGVHLRDLADTSMWEEFDETSMKLLNRRTQELEAIDLYLKELGFIVQHVPSKYHYEEDDNSPSGKIQVPDEYESILTKEGHTVTFTQEEFSDLENGARDAIEGKFYKRVFEQQKK